MIKPRRLWLTTGITIIAILLAIFIPTYKSLIRKSRESVLEANLSSMRSVIKQYIKDKRHAPHSLQDLVDGGYYRKLPIDPITSSNSSWTPVVIWYWGHKECS